ncbi:GT-D fold domain-containing glycosyltransferase [uncultured Wocania sp.]|uniref:GT-D fold domain-containing glycosyltransferase n=1 Tax=uncultured Wocania sp. TaxID=2834404 RepID=UPI0030F5BF0B
MRLTKVLKKRLKSIFEKLAYKHFYKDFREDLILENIDGVKIQTTFDTLNEIENCIKLNQRGAYLRFGDGDVYLLNKKHDSYQNANESLAKEMLEAFQINDTCVFKSLAIHSDKFGYEEGMFDGNHKNTQELSISLLKSTYMFFIGQKIYSPVALHFTATQNPIRANSFLKLLKSKTKLFIGNKELDESVIKILFGSCIHVKTPPKDAYSDIESIYTESKSEIEQFNSFAVVVVAMGCSGRALMKRLFLSNNFNIFLFDFGSLIDGFNDVNSRTWLKVNTIDYKRLTEDLI